MNITKPDKKNITDILGLTPMQEGMLFHYLKEPEKEYYFGQLHLSITGDIDPQIFEEAWNSVIEDNEMLRAVFRWEGVANPVQIILAEYKIQWNYYDLSEKETGEKKKRLEELTGKDRTKAFDLREVPFRVMLCKIREAEYEMIISNHHILYDGWSNGIILKEFFDSYEALDGKKKAHGYRIRRPPKTPFKEFIRWIHDQNAARQEEYWKDYLNGFESQAELSIKQRKGTGIPGTGRQQIEFKKDVTNRLKDFSKNHKITLASFFYGAWGLLLRKYNNNRDVLFGATVSGRSAPITNIENMVGLFINTLPLRVKADVDEKIIDLLRRINGEIKTREEFEYTSLVKIREYSRLDSGAEFFDTIVVVENYPLDYRLSGGMGKFTVRLKSEFEMTHYALTVAVSFFDNINVSFIYDKGVFENDTIAGLAGHFHRILGSILENPGKRISGLAMISEAEKEQILYTFNDTDAEYPQDKTLHRLFEEQAEKTPEKIAVVGHGCMVAWMHGNISITFRELNEKSDQLAHFLREKGVLADDIIAIMLARSIEMIIGIMGILKAGAAYLPIDPAYPQERIDFMLKDSNAKLLVTTNNLEAPDFPLLPATGHRQPAASLAYVIYTSGTTGRPKGVLVEHRNAAAYLYAFFHEFNINEAHTVIQLTSYTFDAFVEEVFPVLLRGGKVVIPGPDELLDIRALSRLIRIHRVNFIDSTPLLLNEFNKLKEPGPFDIIISGGDVLKGEYVDNLLKSGKVYNTYGPTETTVCATYYPYSMYADKLAANIPISIGRPISNYKVYILDKNLNLQPVGVVGELCISGAGVARGYLNRPELTNEKFCLRRPGGRFLKKLPPWTPRKNFSLEESNDQCPMTNDRLYRTGDLARWLPDGNIEFLGRMDHQVKVRGFRVELAEIENRLSAYSGIKETVAAVREGSDRNPYLCAYFVSRGPGSPRPSHLREHLARELPAYMIPDFFIELDCMPLTASGKVDRKALPAPGPGLGREEYTAPRNEMETQLAGLWAEVLGTKKERIGIDSNFFFLGGHSLNAIRLISRLHKAFHVEISPKQLFQNPTIRGLSQSIGRSPESRYTYASMEPVEEKEYYDLSSAQKRLFMLYRMHPTNTAYNMPTFMIIEGNLEKERFERCFKKMMARHESLRTSFHIVNEEPVQRIHDNVEFEIENYTATEDTEDTEKIEEIQNSKFIIQNSFIRPFDLSQAPLFRVFLTARGAAPPILMFDMHHIISDGISIEVFVKEFMALYAGKQLPPLKLKYKDFSEWQKTQQEKNKKAIKKQEEYWLKQFKDEIPTLDLPADHLRPGIQSFEGRTAIFEISKEETAALNQMALEEGTTLFMVLFSIYIVFLSKINSQEDIVVGTPTAGRPHADMEEIIGMFVNTLALRNFPCREKRFKEFLGEVKERTLGAFENQDYPFEKLVERTAVRWDYSRNPLFDTMFTLEMARENMTASRISIEISDLKLLPCEYEPQISKFDLTSSAVEANQTLIFKMEYCTKLFKEETINRWKTYFKKTVSSIIKNPDSKILEIEIITEEEKKQVLFDFNNTGAEYPSDKTIHELFEEQAEKAPDGAAVVGHGCMDAWMHGNISITFGELDEKSDQLAHLLIEKGVQPDIVVGIMIERSIEMIIGILGILKAGCAYLPIDPDYPQERIDYMLEDSGAEILLTNLPEGHRFNCQLSIVNYQLSMNLSEADLHHSSDQFIDHHSGNLAYIIYTSGTTGKPKGTLVTHYNVNRVVRNTNYIELKADDRILQLSNYAFDGSVFDIYGALLNGAVLVMLQKEEVLAVDRLADVIGNRQVTVFFVTTALFNTLVDNKIGCFKHIRKVLFGGERISVEHCRKALEYLGRGKIIHVYGPTETTVYASYYFIDHIEENAVTIPIGKPISNTTAYILDSDLQPLPIGVRGELYIGGYGVSRGYLNRPELTAEKFRRVVISHLSFVISSSESVTNDQCLMTNDRLYRTGDLARWLADGNIEFLGRMDFQVKIRGFRIEPGEIENHLLKHSGVKEAVVLAMEDQDEDKYLCAYVVPDTLYPSQTCSTTALNPVELREFLSMSLPDYMIPSYFVILEKIPLTANGKVNRNALPVPGTKPGEKYSPPRDDAEEKLVGIWSEIFGRHAVESMRIGIDNNFFDLGGHSLKAAVMLSKIHKVFNVKVTLAEIFRTPTIRELARYIGSVGQEQYADLEKVEKKEYYPLSSAQERLYILQQIDKGSIGYNIPNITVLKGDIDKARLENAFRKLIKRHESFRTSFEMIEDEPVQRIHDNVEFEMEYYELATESTEEKKQETKEILQDKKLPTANCQLPTDFIRPFDLSHAPLIRVGLLHTPDPDHPSQEGIAGNKHLLLVDMHHIITDGISINIFIKEFTALYAGEELPPLRLSYIDYIEWRNSPVQKEAIKNQEAYWMKQFHEEIPVLNLPTDYERPLVQSFAGSSLNFTIDSEETENLKALASREEATLFMVLLAIFNILLSRLSGNETIIIGTPVAGRRHADLHQIVGMFVNTLALQNGPVGEKTFISFAREVKETTLKAFENQDYPFEKLVEQVGVNRDAGRNPVFDVMFAFQGMDIPGLEIPGLKIVPYDYENRTAKFDITLTAVEESKMLSFCCEYSTKLFKEQTIQRFITYFKTLLSKVLKNSGYEQSIGEMDILSAGEKQRLLVEFNDPESDYPSDKTLHRLFEEQAEKTPGGAAAVGHGCMDAWMHGNISITFGELNEKSDQLAHLLIEKGVQPDTVVGIMIERSVEMIIGILGILKAGAAYLPIDPDYPGERIDFMLKDSKAELLVTTNNLEAPDFPLLPATGHRPPAASLAYVIYTSGTTGKPKGVPITHANISPLLHWGYRHLGMGAADRSVQNLSYNFDWSVWEIFITLTTGGSLHMVSDEIRLNPEFYAAFMDRNDITVLHITPTHYRYFAAKSQKTGTLRYLFIGAERLAYDLVERCFELVEKDCRVFNMYGPTEATIISAVLEIDRAEYKRFERLSGIPIGRPAANNRLYISSVSQLQLQPVGIPGELYIGGNSLSRGYLNSPELTNEKFCLRRPGGRFLKKLPPWTPRKNFSLEESNDQCPMTNDRLYRSGDLARWLPDGNIEFLGRIDHQVKLRGFRIEPGEIENQLLSYDDVDGAVVSIEKNLPDSKKNEPESKYLCAYITAGKEINISELRRFLTGRLPAYMIPSHFEQLEQMPLTPNGKIDLKALHQRSKTRPRPETAYLEPRTGLEKMIADTWKEVLQIDSVGIEDNFFDLGGNSLDIITVSNKLKEKLKKDIPVVSFFTYPTISSLEDYLSREESSERPGIDDAKLDRAGLIDEGKSLMEQALKKLDQEV